MVRSSLPPTCTQAQYACKIIVYTPKNSDSGFLNNSFPNVASGDLECAYTS